MYAFYSPLSQVAQEAKQLASRLHAGRAPTATPAATSSTSAVVTADAPRPRLSGSGTSSSEQREQPSLWHAVHDEFSRWWSQMAKPKRATAVAAAAARLSVQEGYHAAVLHAQHASSSYAGLGEDLAGLGRSPTQQLAGQHASKAFLEDFVAPADDMEVSYAALLADLCDLAYDPQQLRAEDLMERHQLMLVTTSLHVPFGPITREAWEAQVTLQQRRKARKAQQQAASKQANGASNLSGAADDDTATATAPSHAQEVAAAAPAAAAEVLPQVAAPSAQPALAAAKALAPTNLSEVAAAVAQAVLEEEGKRPLRSLSGRPYPEGSGSPCLTPSVSLVALAALDTMCDDTEGSTSPRAETIPVLTFMPTSPQHTDSSPHAAGLRELDVMLPAGTVPSTMPPQTMADKNGSGAAAATAAAPQVQVPVVAHEAVAGAQGEPLSSQAGALASSSQPPAAWFACDDPVTKIRYFVIQGSTTLEHWQINLQFEPVIFEDPALGVRVHRGVYMAALKLYDELLPCVRQHLASSPFASVTFTGHSLGGSLATVLMLLMVSRGVLPPDSVSPTYTFGAPAVFCGGAARDAPMTRCSTCGLDCPHAGPAAAAAASTPAAPLASRDLLGQHCQRARAKGLFAQLGLGEEHIVNVIMHRDIVPRAFACDYELVADLLMQWMPSLKSMSLLAGADPAHPHKTLYNFLGRIEVLQPDPGCSFANPADATHPHLPSTPALYRMVAPAPKLRVHSLQGTFDLPLPYPSPMASLEDASGSYSDDSSLVAELVPGQAPKAPRTLKQAVAHFVNTPHPLTMLTEYASYGPNGTISRYHNPRNYVLGLRSLVGKAPHQQLPPPADTLPPQLAPACPIPEPGTTPASAMKGGWDLQALCLTSSGLQELAVSPEALRLVVNEPSSTHAPQRMGTGRSAATSPPRAKARAAKVGARARRVMRLGKRWSAGSDVPLLGSLLSAVGYTARAPE